MNITNSQQAIPHLEVTHHRTVVLERDFTESWYSPMTLEDSRYELMSMDILTFWNLGLVPRID